MKKYAAIAVIAAGALVVVGATAANETVIGHEYGPSVSELAERGEIPGR